MNPPDGLELTVSDFVAVLNQSLEMAYDRVIISGELANFRVSKDRWVYFDLKDELAMVKFFGTVYQLPGPLEDGMLLRVRGTPRLHPRYGFSVTVQAIAPSGEGTIRRAAQLLQAKLAAEGLFDKARKRSLPYPPIRLGLITSRQAAAYADFVKILNSRWGGVSISFIDVQVQGEVAPAQIVQAIERFNAEARPPDVVVLIRGGGSAEDLVAYNNELVVRAVAASRAPTLVAIGHEVDVTLAELAADRRASTPSNAAEILVPDRRAVLGQLQANAQTFHQLVAARLQWAEAELAQSRIVLDHDIAQYMQRLHERLADQARLLAVLSPEAVLRRGYAVVRHDGQVLRSVRRLRAGAIVEIQLADGRFKAATQNTADEGNETS